MSKTDTPTHTAWLLRDPRHTKVNVTTLPDRKSENWRLILTGTGILLVFLSRGWAGVVTLNSLWPLLEARL